MKQLIFTLRVNGIPVRRLTSPFRYDAQQQLALNVTVEDILKAVRSEEKLIWSDLITAEVTVTDE